jgi:hypothetical protein
MGDNIYRVGQDGVNTIYKALKMLLKNHYSEIDVTHIDKQTARAIIDKIDKSREQSGSETESKAEES